MDALYVYKRVTTQRTAPVGYMGKEYVISMENICLPYAPNEIYSYSQPNNKQVHLLIELPNGPDSIRGLPIQ